MEKLELYYYSEERVTLRWH